MTKTEIQEHIKRLKNGRAATSDSHQIELIDLGLAKYRRMLADLEKKSNPQPIEKSEQLPQKPDPMYRPTTGKEKEEVRYQKHMEQETQERQPSLLDQVINLVAPPPSNTQIIEIEIDGVIESYESGELRDKARTWFTQTAEGAAIQGKGKLQNSVQFRRLAAVVPNWEAFYGCKPTVQDLHRRHNRHGEAVKKAAVRLLEILTA